MKRLDITGQKFGYLTAIADAGKASSRGRLWLFECTCGKIVTRSGAGVVCDKRASSCGCMTPTTNSIIHTQHGQTGSLTWRRWHKMIERCYGNPGWIKKYYRDRGIIVCSQWLGPTGFTQFLADMGECPSIEYSVERNNVNGNYEPANCSWLLKTKQARNTTKTLRDVNGVAIVELAEMAGLPMSTVYQRLRVLKWSIEKALTTPKFHNGTTPMPDRGRSRHRTTDR